MTASALTPRAMTRLALARPARRMAAVERTWAGATAKLADMADIFGKVSLSGAGGARERRAGRRRPEEWRAVARQSAECKRPHAKFYREIIFFEIFD